MRRVVSPDLVPAVEQHAAERVAVAALPEAASEPAVPVKSAPPDAANPLLTEKLLDAKVRLHRRLIEEINLSALENCRKRKSAATSKSWCRNTC